MVVAVLLVTFGASASAAAVPAPALMLRRSAPLTGLERLQKLDRARFAKRSVVVGEFSLLGLPGVYYTNVKLGTPSKEYSLQFDTGSDLMWVSCSSCTSCPATTNLGIPLEFYSPNSSSTSSNISCSDDRCKDAIREGHSVSPKVFSHCLTSSDDGGGIVVLGEVVIPGFVFTPLVPSQPRYNLNMKSIYVKGKKISIDSSLFTTSNMQGTMVDSGTSLAYLADGIYDPVISVIDYAVPQTIRSFVMSGS
uniref:Uncharacterized protein n=1 Tax=Avena sativa TaxID=4498 RepID=A0ACD6A7M9_AVESA